MLRKSILAILLLAFGIAAHAALDHGILPFSVLPLSVESLPEPGNYAMFLAGLVLMGSIVQRRNSR